MAVMQNSLLCFFLPLDRQRGVDVAASAHLTQCNIGPEAAELKARMREPVMRIIHASEHRILMISQADNQKSRHFLAIFRDRDP
jgi:hypothetical protein